MICLICLFNVSGAYAGAGIQYVIPCSLVFLARRRLDKLRLSVLHLPENPLSSPFRSRAWLVLLMVWSSVAVVLVTTNFIMMAVR